MRAVTVTAAGEGALREHPEPEVGAGELLLRLRCCGLCGTDLFKLAHGVAAGTVLGHELVGTVAAVGAGLEGFAPGDRVVTPHHVPCGACPLCRRGSETLCPVFREDLLQPGGFSEMVLVRERAARQAARRLPPGLADEAALFLEPAACVLRGVRRALPDLASGPGSWDSAAVLGGGGMGLLHLLVLKALAPDSRVLLVEPLAERRQAARRLGADAAVAPPAAAAAAREISGGLGVDAVFDTVGGAAPLEAALGLCREGGAVVLFGHARPGERAGFELNRLFKHEVRLLGTYSGGPSEQRAVFDLLCSGRLDPAPLVTHRLPLSHFAEAVALATGRAALKIVLVPDGSGPGRSGATSP